MKFKTFNGMADTAVRLMLRVPYLMGIYYRLTIYEDPNIPTLCVNDASVWVNPSFWSQLTRDQKLTAITHEIFHPMLLHVTRCGARDRAVWNAAGDYVINLMLVEMKFTPLVNLTIDGKPWSWLYDEKYAGMTTEQVYEALLREAESGGAGDAPFGTAAGNARARLGPFKDILEYNTDPNGDADSGNAKAPDQFEQEIRKLVKDAETQAKIIGASPGWLERVIGNAFHAKVNWFDVLEQYLKGLHRADYSWSRMNRREFIKTGVLNPDMWQPMMGRIAVFIDTSGSVSATEFALASKHLRDVLEQVKPKGIDIAYWDTCLHRHDAFDRCDYTIDETLLRPVGGGGTDFTRFNSFLEGLDEQPDVVLVFTDMCAVFPTQPLCAPTIWLSTTSVEQGPFGECIRIQ